MIQKISKIAFVSVLATLVSQLGFYYVSRMSSITRGPTLKNTAMFLLVAAAAEIFIYVFFEYVVKKYTFSALAINLIAVAFLAAVSIKSLACPVASSEGVPLFRYPSLAVILSVELAFSVKRPEKGNISFKLGIEHLFFVAALALGTVLCVAAPASTLLCYDDGEHYGEALFISEGIYPVVSKADLEEIYMETGFARSGASREDNDSSLNGNDKDYIILAVKDAYAPKKMGLLGGVIGLWTGRLFNLSFTQTFVAGKLGILFVYSLIMVFAVKRLKSGKLFLALCALIPSSLFLAANYSCDPWLIAFFSLGFAYFFGALQRPEEKLSTREMIIMLGAILVGCLPKMPYSFLALLFLLMPREKFENEKQRKMFLTGVVLTFALPYIYTFCTGLMVGDIKDSHLDESANVSGYGQISYMLSHIRESVSVVLRCTARMFSGASVNLYLTDYAFLGSDKTLCWAVLLALAAVAFTDNSDCGSLIGNRVYIRVCGWIAGFLQILAISAMFYIVFTPVGADIVLGCQPRYMLPLVFPLLMLLFNGWIPEIKKGRNVYISLVFVFAVCANVHCMVKFLP